jgi:hypothetical protein
MNLDYYHWGPAFRNEAGEWVYGHFTGSGLAMKFVDETGRILDIYQQLTQLADDHLLNIRYAGWEWGAQARLSAEAALEVSQRVLHRSLTDHCAVGANFHPDLFYVHPLATEEASHARAASWLEGTLDYAAAQSIPIWSAVEWLRFAEIRHDADLEGIQWQPTAGRLSFRVSVQSPAEVDLTIMVPVRHGDVELAQLEVDGLAIGHRIRKVGGVGYAWVSIQAGAHQVAATYG